MLAAIETDKAVVDFEMQEEGYVAAILYPEGSKDVELGKIVAILVEEESDIAAFKDYSLDAPKPAAAAAAPAQASAAPTQAAAPTQQAAPAQAQSGDRVFASPLAISMAKEKGVSLNGIPGTGPNGRVLAADVSEFKGAAAPAQKAAMPAAGQTKVSAGLPDTSAAYEDLENSQIRKVIAERLTYSK